MSNRKKDHQRQPDSERTGDVWARPGMTVTFRAELMPGLGSTGRTFAVAKLLPSGRVTLSNIAGEHAENEFEPLKR
ncbi:MAG: hypothetical protein WKF30_15135 [Pyrinomonadaceae bacterium]